MNKTVDTISIGKLKGMNFFIPSYQRGYRWKEKQVNDLLKDIKEFIEQNKDQEKGGFYCIQPLVVKSRENSDSVENQVSWEVIDGQQRLTTIYLILQLLHEEPYFSMEYETREGSDGFLKNVNEAEKEKNIDYHHIYAANETVKKWLTYLDEKDKEKFKKTLLDEVKFIWYESEDDSIDVFTRLNKGKIQLSDAERSKALFLNSSNFGEDQEKVQLRQKEIAGEWDRIEAVLQNNEFWYFFNSSILKDDAGKEVPRIQVILDLVRKQGDGSQEDTYQYFEDKFKVKSTEERESAMDSLWMEVKNTFAVLEEWYNNFRIYHYIGYLVETNKNSLISDLIKNYNGKDTDCIKESSYKDEFLKSIEERIFKHIDITKDSLYEITYSDRRRVCGVLLLFNIETIVAQLEKIEKDLLDTSSFYRFPFHLYKDQKWDIEHIASQTDNLLSSSKDREKWVECCMSMPDLQERWKGITIDDSNFESFKEEALKFERGEGDQVEDKDSLGNLTLLDARTNRSYGNAIFPAKREEIIKRDQDGTFIPVCTRNIFLKYYSPATGNLRAWTEDDASKHSKAIGDCLDKFLKKPGKTNNEN